MAEKRALLLTELDEVLSRLRERESALAARAAALVSATTISLTLVIALTDKDVSVPTWLVTSYVLLVLASSVSIAGRQLEDPTAGQDWRRWWADSLTSQVEEGIFDAKRLVARVNQDRLKVVRSAFLVHLVLIVVTVVGSLIYVGSRK